MKKVLDFISFLPKNFIWMTPLICTVILYPNKDINLFVLIFICAVVCVFATAFIIFIDINLFKNTAKISEESASYLLSMLSLVVLFVTLTLFENTQNLDDLARREAAEYYLPGFAIDFFSPENLHLKLVYIALTFLITFILYLLRRKQDA